MDTLEIPRDLATLQALRLRYFSPREVAVRCLARYPRRGGPVLRIHCCSANDPKRTCLPRRSQNLMGMSPWFSHPPTVSQKQQYKLLGNSLSVTVVTAILKKHLKN